MNLTTFQNAQPYQDGVHPFVNSEGTNLGRVTGLSLAAGHCVTQALVYLRDSVCHKL